MLHPCEEIFEHSLEPFLDQLVTYLKSHNLLQSGQEIDHVCYRIETINDYLRIVSEMKDKYGKVIADSMISGRPITIIQLHEPILYQDFLISCVELPCPKTGSFYEQGWEHIEVVIGQQGQNCIDNKVELEKFVSEHSIEGLIFDIRAIEKHVNADVSVSVNVNIEVNKDKYSNENDLSNSGLNSNSNIVKKCSIKFHIRPLYEVCKFEMDHGLVEPVPIDYFSFR